MSWLGRKPNVRRLGRQGDLDGLIAVLAYSDVVYDSDGRPIDVGGPIRRDAVAALGEMDDPQAREALVAALRDRDPHVRVSAIHAIREARDSGAIHALTRAVLAWPVPPYGEAREEAIDALEDFCDPQVAERLASALVWSQNGAALDGDAQAVLHRMIDAAPEATPRVLTTMVEALGSREAQVAENAKRVIRWVGEGGAQPLIEAIERPGARSAAAVALGAARDQRAIEPLFEALKDPHPGMRRAAAWALGEVKDPRAAEALFIATADNDYSVRSEAMAALENLGTTAVVLAFASSMRPLLRAAPRKRRGLGSPSMRAGARVAMHRLMSNRRPEDRAAPAAPPGSLPELPDTSVVVPAEEPAVPAEESALAAEEPAVTPGEASPGWNGRGEAPPAEPPPRAPEPPAPPANPFASAAAEAPPAPEKQRAEPPVPLAGIRRAAEARVPGKWALAVVALAVGAGVVAAAAGHGSSAAASAGSVSLTVPDGWHRTDAAPAIPGLHLGDPVTIAAGGAGPRLVAGPVKGSGLPQQVGRALVPSGSPDAVRLGRFEAYRYRGVRSGSGGRATVYLAPTSAGLVAAACDADSGAGVSLGGCERAAGSLAVAGAMPYPLAGLDRYAGRLDGVVRRLNARRASGHARLRAASTPGRQAEAAVGLARVHSEAARDLRRTGASAAAATANRRIVTALDGVARAYSALSRAARAANGARYRTAARSVARADSRLRSVLGR